MYEYPPILRGTVQEQVAALRDYLARLAQNGYRGVQTTSGNTINSDEVDRQLLQIEANLAGVERRATERIENLERRMRAVENRLDSLST